MSLLLNEPDFYYTSILNEETLNSSIINLNGQTGVLKGVNDAIQGSSTTDDLPEGKTNQYFTNARARGAFTAGSGIAISTGGSISNTGVRTIYGTTNQIIVSNPSGIIFISTPQDINTFSTPTFGGLTLTGTLTGTSASLSGIVPLNLSAGNFTDSILYCNASGSGDVYPLGILANLKIAGSGSLYTLDTIQNIKTSSSPTFAGLTLGTLSGVLKATTGTIAGSATTDDLTEGKTNLYFTNARAQGALTAGTGISITAGTIANTGITAITAGTNITTSNTGGSYTINTTTNPTFSVGATIGTLNITNMNSNITNGVSLGTSAGTSGNYNTYIGTQAGTGSVGSGNVGIGYQALAGAGSGSFGLGFTAGYQALTNGNIAIGGSTGQNILTGSGYNIYIGGAPSSSSASYETVIGTSASAPVGKGNNTCFIPNSNGLFAYSPAYWWGYATGQTGGIIGWTAFSAKKNIALKVGDSTQLILPYIGLYELNIGGGINLQASNQSISMYLNGGLYLSQPIYINTPSGWINASFPAFVQVVSANSYVQYAMSGSLLVSSAVPLILTAKFISL
jgi:hypothetical protein